MRWGKRKLWGKEDETKLTVEISKGKQLRELKTYFDLSATFINKKLKEMGFENFRDARRVLYK